MSDKTKETESQQGLQAQLAELERLYNTAPIGLCLLDTDLRYVNINEVLADFNGCPVSEHIGRTLQEIIPDVFPFVEPLFRQVLETGAPYRGIELRSATQREPDRERDWLIDLYDYRSSDGAMQGISVVLQDITERKEAEEIKRRYADELERRVERRTKQLRESETRLRAIVDTAGDGIIVINEHGTIESFNTAAQKIFGYAKAEIIGKNIKTLMPATYREAHERGLAHYLRTGEAKVLGSRVELSGLRRDGTIFPMFLSLSEVGDMRLFTGIVRDITEHKQAVAERERLIGELEAKNTELERFTYTVSHDLKSPLVTIKGFLGLLEKDVAVGNAERVKKDMEHISTAADKMHLLLDDLLELSRIGLMMNPPEEVSLTDLAEEAVSLVAGQIAARAVEVEIAPGLPVVWGDRVRLLEVYQNLLENAVKFMGKQAQPRVEIGATQNGTEVTCYVQDNGVGLDRRYHEKVFELFERLDQHIEGTGVGLALVRRIVEVHGGRTWVESAVGKGATFYFTLPKEAHS